jgi:hypothetical protein
MVAALGNFNLNYQGKPIYRFTVYNFNFNFNLDAALGNFNFNFNFNLLLKKVAC